MAIDFTVKEYEVSYWNLNYPFAMVGLTDIDGICSATIHFVPMDEMTNRADVTIRDNHAFTCIHIDMLDDVIDMLRYEKPVKVSADSGDDIFIIKTGDEPVGEEEARRVLRIGPIPFSP